METFEIETGIVCIPCGKKELLWKQLDNPKEKILFSFLYFFSGSRTVLFNEDCSMEMGTRMEKGFDFNHSSKAPFESCFWESFFSSTVRTVLELSGVNLLFIWS